MWFCIIRFHVWTEHTILDWFVFFNIWSVLMTALDLLLWANCLPSQRCSEVLWRKQVWLKPEVEKTWARFLSWWYFFLQKIRVRFKCDCVACVSSRWPSPRIISRKVRYCDWSHDSTDPWGFPTFFNWKFHCVDLNHQMPKSDYDFPINSQIAYVSKSVHATVSNDLFVEAWS